MIRFDALDVSLQSIRELSDPLRRLRTRDADLERQIRRALTSVPMNLAEGRRRSGRDRLHHWRIAAGSAEEARVGLWVAEAFGYLDAGSITAGLADLDRVIAMLTRMTRT